MRWIPKHAKSRAWFGSARSGALVAGVCLCAVAGVGIWTAVAHEAHTAVTPRAAPTRPSTPVPAPVPASPTASATPDLAAVYPVSLDVPSIKLHTTLQKLGLDATGSLLPPTNLTQAGWYTGSPLPGQDGPAVIAGHVDSVAGPAVFFNLKSLAPGDTITVGLSSGQSAVFWVVTVRHYPKTEFPTADVYGARPDPELRLITCGGGFAAGHYLDNIVVYAAQHTITPPAQAG